MVLHGIAWYCMVPNGIAWYCTVLHGIVHGIATFLPFFDCAKDTKGSNSERLEVGKARSKKLEVGKLEVKKVRSRKIRSRRCWM